VHMGKLADHHRVISFGNLVGLENIHRRHQ
jgi:hypothetical protein